MSCVQAVTVVWEWGWARGKPLCSYPWRARDGGNTPLWLIVEGWKECAGNVWLQSPQPNNLPQVMGLNVATCALLNSKHEMPDSLQFQQFEPWFCNSKKTETANQTCGLGSALGLNLNQTGSLVQGLNQVCSSSKPNFSNTSSAWEVCCLVVCSMFNFVVWRVWTQTSFASRIQ